MPRVVDTDNFGGDYPNEKFVTDVVTEMEAHAFAISHNALLLGDTPRFYLVVPDDYVLVPGFEP